MTVCKLDATMPAPGELDQSNGRLPRASFPAGEPTQEPMASGAHNRRSRCPRPGRAFGQRLQVAQAGVARPACNWRHLPWRRLLP